ncbi:MAG TPA: fused MFS/spermidine synthase [Terriglobales bacterium]|nr:fused MFS/spermidine synthase [Terriglobales bacterium]
MVSDRDAVIGQVYVVDSGLGKPAQQQITSPTAIMGWFFALFVVSGFCSILYELVWLRLAMANYGVTTATVAIVLSAFMAGLGVGSWAAGWMVRRFESVIRIPVLWLYAALEALIGISALLVPLELAIGHNLLRRLGAAAALSSSGHYLVSGIPLAITLVPWCSLMGATFPVAMFAIERTLGPNPRSFSFLYLANVIGGTLGAVLPLLLIEVSGFKGTLMVGLGLNLLLAAVAILVTRRLPRQSSEDAKFEPQRKQGSRWILFLLMLTGFTSMAMEVVWTRLFTPYLGTLVYSFATILLLYLVATCAGSQVYRWTARRGPNEGAMIWTLVGLSGVISLLSADPTLRMPFYLRPTLGIVPFAGTLGFVTPMLVDRWANGEPYLAGRAYAANIFGCVAGPLLAGFLLLPYTGERLSILLLAMPCFAVGIAIPIFGRAVPRSRIRASVQYAALAAAVGFALLSHSYEQVLPRRYVLRDATATVIATTIGGRKELLINGIGTTRLSAITKMMSHLTLAELRHPAKQVLVVGFGMGTAYRSALSWGVNTTVVELVPSVPQMFAYYYADASQLLASPLSHVVIDDGRRYLERASDVYDAIILDPPPPVETAGSSLLYSSEFYRLAKAHLQPQGILQQWLPYGDPTLQSAMAKALKAEFSYVRIFLGIDGHGYHFLASMQPLPSRSAEELAAMLPPAAAADIVEFGPKTTPTEQFRSVLRTQLDVDAMIALAPAAPVLRDDRPVNEFFLLRATGEQIKNIQESQAAWF